MNYFLILIILGLGWGSYYEYGQIQQQNARDKQEFQDTVNARMTHLEDENTKLQATNDDLTKKLAAAQAKTASPTPASVDPLANNAPKPPAPPPLPSNNLGLITTSDGKTYDKCHLLKIDATGITISSTSIITKLKFDSLPEPLQTRFGFDPKSGAALAAAQVQTLEQTRMLSEQQASTAGP